MTTKPLMTALCGWEADEDKLVLHLLEGRFHAPAVFFRRIDDGREDEDRYWHVRVKGQEGVVFVRQDGMGDVHFYGPVKGVLVDPNEAELPR